jgi:hypothetical protein
VLKNLLIILLCCITGSLLGQAVTAPALDSAAIMKLKVATKKDTVVQKIDTVATRITNTNSRIQKLNAALQDPLKAGKNYFKTPTVALPDSIVGRKDTLQLAAQNVKDSVQHAKGKVTAVLSVDVNQLAASKLSKTEAGLTHKIDSMQKLGLPTDRYQKKLDSLRANSVDKLINTSESKLANVEKKINALGDEPESKINEKLNLLSKEAEGKGGLPANVNVPQLNGNGSKLPDVKGKLTMQTPSLPVLENPVEDKMGDLQKPTLPTLNNSMDLPNVDKLKLDGDVKDKLNQTQEIKTKIGESIPSDKIANGTSGVTDLSQQAADYSGKVKDVSKGDFTDQKLESKISGEVLGDETAMLEGKSAEWEKQKQVFQSYKNPEEYKKQTLAKGREVVAKYFVAQQATIKKTMTKVGEYQRTSEDLIKKVNDLPKPPRIYKKIPLIERFIPGINLQIQKTDSWLIDINPSLRFRVKNIFSMGTGWNERIVLDKHANYLSEQRMYGIRTFSELMIKKGISVRIDVERANAFVPVTRVQPDVGERTWLWVYMAGLKKEFKFASTVRGNIQFMYNLYNPDGLSPYLERLNVRFGFEFPLARKMKKSKYRF